MSLDLFEIIHFFFESIPYYFLFVFKSLQFGFELSFVFTFQFDEILFECFNFKGQLISKCNFWCHRFDQKTNENGFWISALASKSNQKSSVRRESKYNPPISGTYKVSLFVWFDHFLEARAEILVNISLVFWSKRWPQKASRKLPGTKNFRAEIQK